MTDESTNSPASPWDFPLLSRDGRMRRLVKAMLGTILAGLRPDIVHRLDTGAAPRTRSERLVLAGLVARCRAAGDMARLMPQHLRYWQSESAVLFHAATEARARDQFGRVHSYAPEMLGELVRISRAQTLCEIGCGSAHALVQFGAALPQLRRLIGLDLSAEQTAINRARYADPRYAFVDGDACRWIPDHAEPGWVFLTYGGVLEYLSEAALGALLRDIAGRAPTALMLIEPIATDYDLAREAHSRPYGDELSLSHNYPRLLAQAGFRELRREERMDGHLRWLAMTATV